MSGTEIAYVGWGSERERKRRERGSDRTSEIFWYALSGTDLAHAPIVLRSCYAMSGTNAAHMKAMSCTNMAYASTRNMQQLRHSGSKLGLPTRVLRTARC
eukprot:1855279-Rhodomonas_salina.2